MHTGWLIAMDSILYGIMNYTLHKWLWIFFILNVSQLTLIAFFFIFAYYYNIIHFVSLKWKNSLRVKENIFYLANVTHWIQIMHLLNSVWNSTISFYTLLKFIYTFHLSFSFIRSALTIEVYLTIFLHLIFARLTDE